MPKTKNSTTSKNGLLAVLSSPIAYHVTFAKIAGSVAAGVFMGPAGRAVMAPRVPSWAKRRGKGAPLPGTAATIADNELLVPSCKQVASNAAGTV